MKKNSTNLFTYCLWKFSFDMEELTSSGSNYGLHRLKHLLFGPLQKVCQFLGYSIFKLPSSFDFPMGLKGDESRSFIYPTCIFKVYCFLSMQGVAHVHKDWHPS